MFNSAMEYQIKKFMVVMKNIFRTVHRSTDVNQFQNGHISDRHHSHFPNAKKGGAFRLHIDESKCIGCGVCVKMCKGNVFRLEKFVDAQSQRPAIEENLKCQIVNPENCRLCGKCIKKCKNRAISLNPD